MEAFSIFGMLLNALSLGRFAQWTVQASARDFVYVNDDGEEIVPTLTIAIAAIVRTANTLGFTMLFSVLFSSNIAGGPQSKSPHRKSVTFVAIAICNQTHKRLWPCVVDL